MVGNLHRLLYIATVVPLPIAVIAIIILLLAGTGYRLEWWEFRTGFVLLQWGAYLGVAAAVLAVPAGALLLWHGPRSLAILAGLTVVAGIAAAAIPYTWQQRADSVPAIHDISTDTENPPAFVAIAPLRRDVPNPVEYAGEATASAQREAYPDIQPIRLDAPPERVFSAVKQAAAELGWELVDADENDGRIEAIDTTRWFGFKDDVVIRILADNGQTKMDVRSKSRIGRSDVGTNARRIRVFREVMQTKLTGSAEPETNTDRIE